MQLLQELTFVSRVGRVRGTTYFIAVSLMSEEGKGLPLAGWTVIRRKRQQIVQTSKSKQTCTIFPSFSSFTGSKGDT